MPELPEVETTLNGLKPYIEQQVIANVIVRHLNLRWPIPADLKKHIINQKIIGAERRGKYILLKTKVGTIIIHLGMSGSLRILTSGVPPKKHDHVDLEFSNNKVLRLTDPRRFGAFLWTSDDPLNHPLLKNLGPEPLNRVFTGKYLWERAQGRKVAIKSFIMDSKIVVGVGNIYATEALFNAGIHPALAAGKLSQTQYETLVHAIKAILRFAIKQGGTTLKDFLQSDGKPGYFKLHLKAYGRNGLPCLNCKKTLKEIKLGQRSSVYCPICQK